MRLTKMAATALLALGTAGIAAPLAPAPEAPKSEDKLVCKRISDNPTDRLAKRRKVCMTAAQWKEARRTERVEMPKQQSMPSY